jgi:hypothetical protein
LPTLESKLGAAEYALDGFVKANQATIKKDKGLQDVVKKFSGAMEQIDSYLFLVEPHLKKYKP